MTANERVKFISTMSGNLGAALLATAAGRWFLNGLDLLVALWLSAACALIWMGWYILMMIAEDDA